MENDRELLEAAAKAAGINLEWHHNKRTKRDDPHKGTINSITPWNPLTDDGDALRLAMNLGLVINCRYSQALVETADDQFWERHTNGEDAATRRAIVRAAAAIGKEKS